MAQSERKSESLHVRGWQTGKKREKNETKFEIRNQNLSRILWLMKSQSDDRTHTEIQSCVYLKLPAKPHIDIIYGGRSALMF